MKVSVIRKNVMFMPDSSRVVARFFRSGDQQTQELVGRIMTMDEQQVNHTLEQIFQGFARRHPNISAIFFKHFENIRGQIQTKLSGAFLEKMMRYEQGFGLQPENRPLSFNQAIP